MYSFVLVVVASVVFAVFVALVLAIQKRPTSDSWRLIAYSANFSVFATDVDLIQHDVWMENSKTVINRLIYVANTNRAF